MLELSTSLFLSLLLLVFVPRRFQGPVVGAFVLRVMLSYLHAYLIELPDSQFDAVAFEWRAWLWAQDGECLDDFTTGSQIYSWMASCVYLIAGRSALTLQIINSFLGAIVVLVGIKTIRLFEHRDADVRALSWMLALHPSLLLYSAITMREVIVVLTFMLAFHWFIRWLLAGRYPLIVFSMFWMIGSQLIHTGMITGTIVIGAFAAHQTVTRHLRGLLRIRFAKSDMKAALVAFALAIALIGGLSIMLDYGYGLDKLQTLRTERIIDTLSEWQERSARGRASYLEGQAADNWIGISIQLPLRLLYFLAAPFPWNISRARDLWGFFDGLFWVYFSVLIWRQVRNGVCRRRPYLATAALLCALILGFATVTSNYGTAFRHRAKFVPAMVVLYSMGRSYGRSTYRSASDTLESAATLAPSAGKPGWRRANGE